MLVSKMKNNQIIYLRKEFLKIGNFFAAKQFDEVIVRSRGIIKKHPKVTAFYNLLGLAHRQKGNYNKAEIIFKEANHIDPANISVLCNLGAIYRLQNNYEKSFDCFERALKINPNDVNLLCNFGNVKRDKNDLKGAIILYEKAFELDNTLTTVLINLAGAHQITGNFEECIKYSKRLLEIDPKFTIADKFISDIHKYVENDEHQLEMLKKDKIMVNSDDKLPLNYALAKSFNDQKNYKESFKYLKIANDTKRANLGSYSIDHEIKSFKDIKEKFNKIYKNIRDDLKVNDQKIIFIVGLPRSGTTLSHQILSSHSNTYGAGELGFMSQLIGKNLMKTEFENAFTIKGQKSDDKIKEFYKAINDYLKFFNHSGKIIIDKAPLNFRWLGFIKILFPQSKIIHCTRDAKDTCWSIYKSSFDGSSLGWSYKLDELVKYNNLYKELMRYWNDYFPEEIYELNYESLINNQELESKKLFEFCKIPWEIESLEFYKSKETPIKTVSIVQARQPIYKTSIKASDNYSEFLEIFKELQ